jgi:ATP-dependent RNA helicase DDX27
VKAARLQGAKAVSRVLPIPEIDTWADKLEALADDVKEVLNEEREEKLMTVAERDMKRGENLMVHEDEIMSRPKRTWFESEKEKKAAKDAGKRELNGEISVGKKEKRKLSNKEKKRLNLKDERKEGRMWKKGKGNLSNVKVVTSKAKGMGKDKMDAVKKAGKPKVTMSKKGK